MIKYKAFVKTEDELPIENNEINDHRLVTSCNKVYTWTGSEWEFTSIKEVILHKYRITGESHG